MILPIGTISPDTVYQFPNFYGIGYGFGGRTVARQPAAPTPPVRAEMRDTVTLSPAAQRLMDQAERLNKMQPSNKE
jgi:hypothetical protein